LPISEYRPTVRKKRLDSQHQAVYLFDQREGYQVTTEFTEIESGKKNDRPELMAAMVQYQNRKQR
jgi:hypothetical protein